MRNILTTLGALVLTTTAGFAGGIERSTLSYSALFDKGRVLTTSFSSVSPSVSGTYPLAFGGGSTGNMAQSYTSLSFSYKADINDKLAYALYFNQPFGADALYTSGPYTGLEAHWKSDQLAAVLKYQVTDAVAVYGGLRYLSSEAEIAIPAALLTFNYTAEGTAQDFGYLVGVAYEKPEIALRVSLTYESAINQSFATTERGGPFGAGFNGVTEIELPQSVALDFQSGVAKDTLVFGSIRWTEWSAWEVRPPGYAGLTGQAVTGFDDNVLAFKLGVGRKLSESLSVFARIGYEEPKGGIASRLSPTDGSKSIGIGGSFTKDNMKITGGLEYVQLGDATDGSGTVFSGSTAVGLGISVAFTF